MESLYKDIQSIAATASKILTGLKDTTQTYTKKVEVSQMWKDLLSDLEDNEDDIERFDRNNSAFSARSSIRALIKIRDKIKKSAGDLESKQSSARDEKDINQANSNSMQQLIKARTELGKVMSKFRDEKDYWLEWAKKQTKRR